jgi:hypothetical protein
VHVGSQAPGNEVLTSQRGSASSSVRCTRTPSRSAERSQHQASDLAAGVERVVRVRPQFVVVNREQPDVELSAHPSQEVIELTLFERIPFSIQEGERVRSWRTKTSSRLSAPTRRAPTRRPERPYT